MQLSKNLPIVILIIIILFYILYLKKGHISLNKICLVFIILLFIHVFTNLKYKNLEQVDFETINDVINKSNTATGIANKAVVNVEKAVVTADEAIANIASIYNSKLMTVNDLHVTGILTVDSKINASNGYFGGVLTAKTGNINTLTTDNGKFKDINTNNINTRILGSNFGDIKLTSGIDMNKNVFTNAGETLSVIRKI